MITVTKIFEFPAGHHLPYHAGACKNQHGHNFKLEITIGKRIVDLQHESLLKTPSCGMVIDFSDLKKIVNKYIVEKFDHNYLNDIIDNPTAEELILFIKEQIQVKVSSHTTQLVGIKLWESSTSFAEWRM